MELRWLILEPIHPILPSRTLLLPLASNPGFEQRSMRSCFSGELSDLCERAQETDPGGLVQRGPQRKEQENFIQ